MATNEQKGNVENLRGKGIILWAWMVGSTWMKQNNKWNDEIIPHHHSRKAMPSLILVGPGIVLGWHLFYSFMVHNKHHKTSSCRTFISLCVWILPINNWEKAWQHLLMYLSNLCDVWGRSRDHCSGWEWFECLRLDSGSYSNHFHKDFFARITSAKTGISDGQSPFPL